MTDRYKKDKRIDGHPLRDTETGHLVIGDVVMALLNVQDEDCKHKAEQIAELKENSKRQSNENKRLVDELTEMTLSAQAFDDDTEVAIQSLTFILKGLHEQHCHDITFRPLLTLHGLIGQLSQMIERVNDKATVLQRANNTLMSERAKN